MYYITWLFDIRVICNELNSREGILRLYKFFIFRGESSLKKERKIYLEKIKIKKLGSKVK